MARLTNSERSRRYRLRHAYMAGLVCDLCMGGHVTSRCTLAARTLEVARTPGLLGKRAALPDEVSRPRGAQYGENTAA